MASWLAEMASSLRITATLKLLDPDVKGATANNHYIYRLILLLQKTDIDKNCLKSPKRPSFTAPPHNTAF